MPILLYQYLISPLIPISCRFNPTCSQYSKEAIIKHGIFKKASTRVELPDGTTQFAITINNNPEKYFTEEVLDKLNEAARQEFLYGNEIRTDDTQESDTE